jgi:hypothetical protein
MNASNGTVCPECGQVVMSSTSLTAATIRRTDDAGNVEESFHLFHPDCFDAFERKNAGTREVRPCGTCGGSGVQQADEIGREGQHVCLDCGGDGYVPVTLG